MIDLETSIIDGIREQVEKSRPHWIGGVPTAAEMNGIYRKVASRLGIDQYQVDAIARRNAQEIVG